MLIDGTEVKSLEGPRQIVNNSVGGSFWRGAGSVDALIPSNTLSRFENNGLFTIENDASWNDGFVVNNGTIVKAGGNGTSVFNSDSGGLSNAGVIDILRGGLLLRGSGTQTGEFALATDETSVTFMPGTQFIAGVHELGNGAAFTGNGLVTTRGPGVVLAGLGSTGTTVGSGVTLDLSGDTITGNGILTNAGTLVLDGTTLGGNLVNTGVVRVLGNSTHNGSRVDMNGGRIEVADDAEVTKDGGTFVWSDGTLAGPGTYDQTNGATFATAGSGNRVIDGAPILLPSLDVAAGTLELRSGALTVGTGQTRFAPGSTFIVNNGVATLFGPADIANLRVNGGTFDARNSLTIGSLVQTGGNLIGGGALSVRENFSTTGGSFGSNWASIDIVQTSGNLTLNRTLDTSGSFAARVTNGALRIENAEISGNRVSVEAGSLTIAAGNRATGLVGEQSASARISGTMALQGGSSTNATVTFGATSGQCDIDAASLALNDGSAANTGARIIGSPTIGSASNPLNVADSRVTVNGIVATSGGSSGFFVVEDDGDELTPATFDGNTLFLRRAASLPGGVTASPAGEPPPPVVQPAVSVTVVSASVVNQTASALASRPPSFLKATQDDEQSLTNLTQQRSLQECR
jgi:filamentous hemagglutinin